jgi:hypothetical protein
VIFLASTTLPIPLLLSLLGRVKYAKQSAAEEQGKEERDNEVGSDLYRLLFASYKDEDKLRIEDLT